MWVALAVAGILLALGLLIDKGKMYFLISGYNTMPKAKREKVNIQQVARLFGVWAYANAAVVALVAVALGLGVDVWVGIPLTFFGVTTLYLLVRAQRYDGNIFDEHGDLRPGAWKQLVVVGVVVVGLIVGIAAIAIVAE